MGGLLSLIHDASGPECDADADALLDFCLQNDQYYRYCGKQPSRELILHGFKGLREDGITEIGYGILEEHRGQGYATESVQAACQWAFGHAEVKLLEAKTDAGNAASQRVLQKCGFRPNGIIGEEGLAFPLPRWK